MGSIYVEERDLLLESKLLQVHPLKWEWSSIILSRHTTIPHKGRTKGPCLLQALELHPKCIRDIMEKLKFRDIARNYLPCPNGLTRQPRSFLWPKEVMVCKGCLLKAAFFIQSGIILEVEHGIIFRGIGRRPLMSCMNLDQWFHLSGSQLPSL